MAFINRLSRLIAADVHAVLDRIEEPASLLKQAVREMEEEIAKMEARGKSLEQALARAVEQESEYGKRLLEIAEELDVCFESGEEALARNLVKRKLETEKRAKALVAKRESLDQGWTEHEATLGESQAYLASMREKLEVLVEEQPGRPAAEAVVEFSGADLGISADDIEIAFLKEKQRRCRT